MFENSAILRDAELAANALLRLRVVEDSLEPGPGTRDQERAWSAVFSIRSVREEVTRLLEEICEHAGGELYGDAPAGGVDEPA